MFANVLVNGDVTKIAYRGVGGGGGGKKILKILRTYFMDDPLQEGAFDRARTLTEVQTINRFCKQ